MAGRRLTAILAADIAGYSALMGANDIDTVSSLKGHQSVVLPMIAGFEGRIIDTAGDGILAEFPSVLNAVKCAVAIQEVMLERNASVVPDRRMQFRIGINQGDVLFDEHRIFGDGINIAARLEGLCDPGGICISGKVYEEIKGRFEVRYKDIGEQSLKNIAAPVRAYKISTSGKTAGEPQSVARPMHIPRKVWIATAVVSTLLFGIGAAWWSLNPYQSTEHRGDGPLRTENSPAVISPVEFEARQSLPPAGTRAESGLEREKIQVATVLNPPAVQAPSNAPAVQAAPVASAVLAAPNVPAVQATPIAPTVQAAPKPAPISPTQAEAAVQIPDKKPSNDSWDVAALYRQGQLYAKQNDYSRAKLYFDEILRLQPKEAEALNNRCWARAILGELAAALNDCDEALRLRPNYVDALDSRAFVKLKNGMARDAIADYDAALKLQGQKASSLYGRGIAKQRAGNTAGGNVDIARAKTIDPRVADEFAGYGIR